MYQRCIGSPSRAAAVPVSRFPIFNRGHPLKREIALEEQFLPYRKTYLEGLYCLGKQTGSSKICLLL